MKQSSWIATARRARLAMTNKGERLHVNSNRSIALRPRVRFLPAVETLLLLAPLFLVLEVAQLVFAERYLGLKQIARGADPRALAMSESTAFLWTVLIVVYWLWMLLLLATTPGRTPALALLGLSLLGFTLRRGSPLKWLLVILTFEGALRIVALVALCTIASQQVRG